ncbi:RICIN domain-containing protein [Methanolobus psychrotolerans]|uniref:RICIN domain-containing protein n=1 Tax=Methanolobus psychrotolerans TaxID=1874706 RepID=UPI000B91968D|nr:RICIN domain-containing protein [Methanolobus psychrotolerans]
MEIKVSTGVELTIKATRIISKYCVYCKLILQLFALFTILQLIGAGIYPALAASSNDAFYNSTNEPASISPVEVSALNAIAQSITFANQRDTGIDLDALMAAIPVESDGEGVSSEPVTLATDFSDIDMNLEKYGPDNDGDGIPDSIEMVLGTDINNTDSDFDRLDDLFEIENGLDPLNPDSNYDGLPDYYEVHGSPYADIDGDGFENAWDLDNDNDGVIDALDLSPFSRSISSESFEFNLTTNGNPTYLNFQIRPEDPEHLKMLSQSWDWPDDALGTMKDLNSSKNDVTITPMLELTVPVDCKIVSFDSGECLELLNASQDDMANVTMGIYTGEDYQLWRLEQVEESYYSIISADSGKCLEIFNASQDDMANVTVGNYTAHDHQLWKLEMDSNGLYKIAPKHSGKCLETNSTSNVSIYQNPCQETDRQLWELELVGGILSDRDALEDYGIITTLSKAYVPLSAVKDFGNTVALNGRMFYPQDSAAETVTQAQLTWMVRGQTDRPKKVSLKTHKGQYVSVDGATSELVAKSTSVTNNEIFDIVYLNNNKVALKTPDDKYVYAANGGGKELIANSTEIGEWEIFELLDLENDRIALKANSSQYLSAEDGGGKGIVANKDERKDWESFTLMTHEYESVTTTLATYNDRFMLTGFNVEENYGSDFGIFFSEDKEHVFEAGLVLSYAFLRDQNPLDRMPDELRDEYNITINYETGSSSHQDEALAVITGEITPAILSSLPADMILPVIAVFEDDFRHMAMDDLALESYITGNNFDIKLKEQPLITTKGMKMSWYETGTNVIIATEDMLEEVRQWGNSENLDRETVATLMNLMIAWETGESTVTKIGTVETDFSFPEGNEVLDAIDSYGIAAIELVCSLIIGGVALYSYLTFVRLEPLALTGGQTSWRLMKAMTESISKISSGFMGAVNRTASVLGAIAWVVVGAIAFYAFWSIAASEGWSGYGIFVGTLYATLMVLYAIVLMAIASIPVVGWAIAAIVALSDLIFGWIFGKGWSQMLFEWFIGLFTDVRVKTEADLKILSTSVKVIDHTDNGLTEGDRIELESRFEGIITRTSRGSFTNLQNSYISPQYKYSSEYTLAGNSSTEEGATTYLNSYLRKETEYKANLWIEPEAAVNFPFKFWLSSDFKVYYDKCWWLFGWHCSEKSNTGTSDSDPSTLYFDVMPNDLESFVLWTAISSNDIDGDGVLNPDELGIGSSQIRWDTDNDGLSDGYEIEYGTSPVNKDTDGDGLEDGLELRYGYDPLNMDTDGDGLSDFEEHRGWDIEFELYDQTFTRHVWSSPLKQDTDDDGLSDFSEFLKGLNPHSKDTNGNGIPDPDDPNFISKAYISNVDLNGMGSSIKADKGTNITAVIDYTLTGKADPASNNTSEPARCWLLVSLDNSTVHEEIYNGTPSIGTETSGSATLWFNASNSTDVFKLRFYQTWNLSLPAPPEEDRDVIGIIDTHDYPAKEQGWVNSGEDRDRDSLIDVNEQIGWPVQITNSTGTYTIHVTSDPRFKDSDFDGLDDHTECYIALSDPRNHDSDTDGLSDYVEYILGTDPRSYDTDGDGLDDGTEIFWGSSPLIMDTDGDGLDDLDEYLLSSNPLKADTDNDGLTDLEEYGFGSDLLKPDSDDDGLFDYLEWVYGTDPLDPDTDGDGLDDGHEVHGTGTDPLSEDTDLDGLKDPVELELLTNPLSADTDNDGLTDLQEINLGTNPLNEDTDGDNLNDSLDMDSFIQNVRNIAVVYDMSEENENLLETLSTYTNITVYSADELMLDHTDEPYILLLGRPVAVNGTAGNITYNVLSNNGNVLPNMLTSDHDRMTVRHGVWNATQTVVMLSKPYMYDYCRILDAFRSKQVTASANSMHVEYMAPGNIFVVESADSIKRTDSSAGMVLDANITPWIELRISDSSSIPLSSGTGLASEEYAIGKYLDITVSENIENANGSIMNSTLVTIYYRFSELDRNGDGDVSDPYDIDENTLCIYYFNEDTRRWIKLPYTGIHTGDVEMYGESYAGYVWARVSHLSSFSLAGKYVMPDTGGPLDSDLDGLPNVMEYRIGTDPFNPDTDGDGMIDSLDPDPLVPFGAVQEDEIKAFDTPEEPSGDHEIVHPAPQETASDKKTSLPAMIWLILAGIIVVLSYLVLSRRRG